MMSQAGDTVALKAQKSIHQPKSYAVNSQATPKKSQSSAIAGHLVKSGSKEEARFFGSIPPAQETDVISALVKSIDMRRKIQIQAHLDQKKAEREAAGFPDEHVGNE